VNSFSSVKNEQFHAGRACPFAAANAQDNLLPDKCLVVAEMGNRLATIDIGENWGCCALFWRGEGELGLHLTQC